MVDISFIFAPDTHVVAVYERKKNQEIRKNEETKCMFGSTFFSHLCVLRFFFFFSRVLAKRGYCLYTVQWTVTAKVDFSVANNALCTVYGPTNSTF